MNDYSSLTQEPTGDVGRVTVQALEDIPNFEGVDRRTYDLRESDIIALPEQDANRLLAGNLAEVILCRS